MKMIPLIWIVIQNTLWTDWLMAKIPLIDWLKVMLRNVTIQKMTSTDWLKAMQRNVNLQKMPSTAYQQSMLKNANLQKMTSTVCQQSMQRNANLQKMPSTACLKVMLRNAIPEIYCYNYHWHYCGSRYSNYACYSYYNYYGYELPLCYHDNLHDNLRGDDSGYDDKHQLLLQQKQQNKVEDMCKYKGDNRVHIQVNKHIAQPVLIQQLQR
jgi:hypothetical protein